MVDPYRFISLGPYEIPTVPGERAIDFSCARDVVFEQAQFDANEHGDIKSAIGCYVFALSPPGGPAHWPYYVGRASRQTLYRRLFQATDKPRLYQDIMQNSGYVRAKPLAYLLPLLTPTGRFAKLGTNCDIIGKAEYMLIGVALKRNWALWNSKNRKSHERFVVEGVGANRTPGRERQSIRAFKSMMGLEQTAKKRKRGTSAPDSACSSSAELADALLPDQRE